MQLNNVVIAKPKTSDTWLIKAVSNDVFITSTTLVTPRIGRSIIVDKFIQHRGELKEELDYLMFQLSQLQHFSQEAASYRKRIDRLNKTIGNFNSFMLNPFEIQYK